MKIFGKIPLSMSYSFWIVAALIGYFNTQTLIGMLLWICVIFVSVLVHELGHAIPAFFMGLNPRIDLIAFGGVTGYLKGDLSLGKQFLVTLTGPLFGLLLFFLALGLNHSGFFTHPFLVQFLGLLQVVNLFWTLINLIPVLPLDGGQMLRIGLDLFFRPKGRYYALIVGTLIAGAAAIFFFFHQMLLLGAFFFLFAYQNGSDAKKEKYLYPEDMQVEAQKKWDEVNELLRSGNKEEAFQKLEALAKTSQDPRTLHLVSQSLAFLQYEKGEKEKALELLLPRKKTLSGESLYLLQKVAFELHQYRLVIEISGDCFRSVPFIDVSQRAACSHAAERQLEPCLGWLEASLDLGAKPSLDLVSDPLFDLIKETPPFAKWVETHLTLKKD